jgi:hypothetical protein
VKALTIVPAPCIRDDVLATPDLELRLGRLAFESPALLGGAAGRMGLSCASCHRNGRDNPDFFVEGLSGAPGTADITSSLFSRVRGNGTFDPVAIPDLVTRDGNQMTDRGSEAFRTKIHGLVVEEFDGQEPPAIVFDALLAYLDALSAGRCPDATGEARINLETDLAAITGALGLAAFSASDPQASLFLIRAARERLERIHERYAGPDLAKQRGAILAASQTLADEAEKIRAGGTITSQISWSGVQLREILSDAESRSLYNPEVLRAALAQ